MNDNEVICEIKWTIGDVKTAFVNKYGRLPNQISLEIPAVTKFLVKYEED